MYRTTTDEQRQVGFSIGRVYESRRMEQGFTLTELSRYLTRFMDRSPGTIVQRLKGLELGGSIASNLIIGDSTYRGKYEKLASDYGAALRMPNRSEDVILEAFRALDPGFEFYRTNVAPYTKKFAAKFRKNRHLRGADIVIPQIDPIEELIKAIEKLKA